MTSTVWKYFYSFLALIILLGLTFFLAHIDLGPLNLFVGLGIAFMKVSLVILYFMHLKEEAGLHRVAAGVGVFWLGILIALVLADYLSRNWLLLPSPWPRL